MDVIDGMEKDARHPMPYCELLPGTGLNRDSLADIPRGTQTRLRTIICAF
jgi:hypothetical protein